MHSKACVIHLPELRAQRLEAIYRRNRAGIARRDRRAGRAIDSRRDCVNEPKRLIREYIGSHSRRGNINNWLLYNGYKTYDKATRSQLCAALEYDSGLKQQELVEDEEESVPEEEEEEEEDDME